MSNQSATKSQDLLAEAVEILNRTKNELNIFVNDVPEELMTELHEELMEMLVSLIDFWSISMNFFRAGAKRKIHCY